MLRAVWSGCGWGWWPADGASQGERTQVAVDAIAQRWASTPLVWGGDWNHELVGRISAGSKVGREAILGAIRDRGMHVPTAVLGSENGFGSVNHIAVPDDWKVMNVERLVASSGGRRLSDHDAYVVEIAEVEGDVGHSSYVAPSLRNAQEGIDRLPPAGLLGQIGGV